MSEQVLVVPTELFKQCGYFQGFRQYDPVYDVLFHPGNCEFRPRDEVETDPSWKQLIPYVVLKRFGLFAAYWRGKGQGEARLRGKRSVGIGGHINPEDADAEPLATMAVGDSISELYKAGLIRELHEEIVITGTALEHLYLPVIGMINDDSNDVGKVHLGIVHGLALPPAANVTAHEEDIIDLQFRTLDQLCAARDEFETWSQIVLDNLGPSRTTKKPGIPG